MANSNSEAVNHVLLYEHIERLAEAAWLINKNQLSDNNKQQQPAADTASMLDEETKEVAGNLPEEGKKVNDFFEMLPEQEAQLTELITEAVPAEKVYLLGSTDVRQRTQSIFACDAPNCRFISHYFILATVNKNSTNSCHNLEDKIENHCRSIIPVTAIVIHTDQLNDWLTEGHPFACKVSTTAKCLYDTGTVTLAVPKASDSQELMKINEALYNAGINKVQEFLAGADLYRIREQNKMAAFMLHQAAEQALHTLFRITTGLYLNLHSIDKLMRYCSMVSSKLTAIFPRNNEKNERLFQLLQKAYIDTRYKEDYSIKTEDLLTITERVRALEGVVKEAYMSLKK